MDDQSGHSPKLSLPIDLETARRWLEGEGDPLATQTAVFNGCYRWLCFHHRGLLPEKLEEIAWVAMAEAFSTFRTDHVTVQEALLALQRALNRLRAREDRRRQFERPLEEGEIDRIPNRQDDQNQIFDRDFWRQVARLVERHLMAAFVSLAERDQDILACAYGLHEAGDPQRAHTYPIFPSLEAEKKALTRARQRINHHLESLLVAELNERVLDYDRPLYEAALRVVRGGVHFGGSRRKR